MHFDTPTHSLPGAPARSGRRLRWPAAAIALLLIACSGADPQLAHASRTAPWPPTWQDQPGQGNDLAGNGVDFSPLRFTAPSARDCHRLPLTREVPGTDPQWQRGAIGDELKKMSRGEASDAVSRRKAAEPATDKPMASGAAAPMAAPAIASREEARQRHDVAPNAAAKAARVTAAMVDDNADFGEYMAYRQRQPSGMAVRERDISERYLLEVTDAQGHPVHDAEVAVQRAGVAEPVMWARTDTAGRVWLHPRAFLAPDAAGDRSLGVAVRKGGAQARTTLQRGQSQALQLQLGGLRGGTAGRPRLDLVFMVDATGSMGDEIAKLKASMHAMSQQIGQLPGQPDVCYGLVVYRDRGDAFLTRSHDFTDDLGAFQKALAQVQAAGGGDTPEALNEALSETVHQLSWRADAARMVVMVADAPPHIDYGGPQYDRDMQAALAKGIKLFAVGASGLDPVGEYVFRQLAQYTAGRFVFLTYRDAANPGSGPGTQTVHDVKQYSVQTLDRLVVRLVGEELSRLKLG